MMSQRSFLKLSLGNILCEAIRIGLDSCSHLEYNQHYLVNQRSLKPSTVHKAGKLQLVGSTTGWFTDQLLPSFFFSHSLARGAWVNPPSRAHRFRHDSLVSMVRRHETIGANPNVLHVNIHRKMGSSPVSQGALPTHVQEKRGRCARPSWLCTIRHPLSAEPGAHPLILTDPFPPHHHISQAVVSTGTMRQA